MLERFKNYRPQAATKKIIDRANRIIADLRDGRREPLSRTSTRHGRPGQLSL